MDENEFEFEGVALVSCDPIPFHCCNGCYFDRNELCIANAYIPRCSAGTRSDGRNVIFVEKNP